MKPKRCTVEHCDAGRDICDKIKMFSLGVSIVRGAIFPVSGNFQALAIRFARLYCPPSSCLPKLNLCAKQPTPKIFSLGTI